MNSIKFNKLLIKSYKSFLVTQSPLYDRVSISGLNINNIINRINKLCTFNFIYKRQLSIFIRHLFSYNSKNVHLYDYQIKNSAIFNYLFYDIFILNNECMFLICINLHKLKLVHEDINSNYIRYYAIDTKSYLSLRELIYTNPILLEYIKHKKLWILYLKYRFPKIFGYL